MGRPVVRLDTGEVGKLAFSPDERFLVCAGPDGLRFYEVGSGREVLRYAAHERQQGDYGPAFANAMAYAPDGRTLVTGHADTTVLVWDLSPLVRRPAGKPLSAAG